MLADYAIERRTIVHRGRGLCTVRGLNFDDVSVLIRRHIDELRELLLQFPADPGKLLPDTVDVNALLFSLVTQFPDTAARMIALACDEPNATEQARALAAPLQMQILAEIVSLTFEDVGGPLAFLEMLKLVVAQQLRDHGRYAIQTVPLSEHTETSGIG